MKLIHDAEFIIKTNPYDFEGATKAELGYGPEVTTGAYYDYEAKNGQHLGVYGTQPVAYGELTGEHIRPRTTMIVPASHEYRFESENLQKQLEQLATENDALVVFVDTPGTTGLYRSENGQPVVHETTEPLHGVGQTAHQRLAALHGDFRQHAAVQLEAVDALFGLGQNTRYIIRGESMGAAVATDMLGLMHERGLFVDEVQMHEMVNAFQGKRPTLPLQLMKVLPRVENDRRNLYIAENTAIGHPSTAFELSGATDEARAQRKSLDDARKSPLKQQGADGMINGLGMSKGRFDALKRSLNIVAPHEWPLLTMIRGNESLATNAEDYRHFVRQLRIAGAAVRSIAVVDGSDLEIPMGHSHTFSLGRGKKIYEELDKHA